MANRKWACFGREVYRGCARPAVWHWLLRRHSSHVVKTLVLQSAGWFWEDMSSHQAVRQRLKGKKTWWPLRLCWIDQSLEIEWCFPHKEPRALFFTCALWAQQPGAPTIVDSECQQWKWLLMSESTLGFSHETFIDQTFDMAMYVIHYEMCRSS